MDGKRVICGISEMKYFYMFDSPSNPSEADLKSGESQTPFQMTTPVRSASKKEWKSTATLRMESENIEVSLI